MPTQQLRLINTEDREYRARLSRLEQLGIPIGHPRDPPPEPDRLTLEQIPDDLAKIYELGMAEVAVVVPARMTVLSSGILITDVAMTTPWEDTPLDLWDPEEGPYYQDVIGGLCQFPPTVLNPWLEHHVALRPRQVEGVIIAHGYVSVPAECHDETQVGVKLLLMDRRRNEFSFEFGVRVDRSVMRKYERLRRERLEFARLTRGGGTGLYGPQRGQAGDRQSVSREGAIKPPYARGERDVTCGSPASVRLNPERKT